MKILIQKYNHIFLWIVMAVPLVMQYFPQANKFDLVERFLPVLFVAFVITIGCMKGWVWSWWKNRDSQEKNGKARVGFKGPDKWMLVIVTLFALWSTIAFITGHVRTFGFTEIYMLWVGVLIFMYFGTCHETEGEYEISLLEKYLPVGLSLLLLANAFGGVYGFLTTDHTRFFGLFYNPEIKADAWPNAYALFFILTFPFFIYRLFHGHFEKYKGHLEGTHTGMMLLKLILAGFVYGTFLMVFSRAGYIAFIGGLALMIVFAAIHLWPTWQETGAKKHILHWIAGAAIVALVGWGTAVGLQHWKSLNWETTDVSGRLTFSDSQGATSFNERFEFFEGAIELAKTEPFFGYGPSSFKWVYPQVQQGFLSLSDHPHNWFFKFAVERGIPAAALMLALLILLFVRTNPFSLRTSMFTKVAWVSLAAALAHQLVDHNFNFITNYLIFWLIVTALLTQSVQHTTKRSDKLSLLIATVTILAIALSSFNMMLSTFKYRLQGMQPSKNSLTSYGPKDLPYLNPMLPRWWFLRLDDQIATWEPNELETEEVILQARTTVLEKHISYNPYDPEPYSRLGQLALDADEPAKALEYFKTATEVQPKNTFEYYAWYAFTGFLLGDNTVRQELLEVVPPLIEEYTPLYEANLHFTQRDGELKYIEELQSLLGL